jgi:DNA polymerase-1
MKLVIFDAETNGLLDELDRVHVLVLRVFNGENSGVQVFRRNQVEDSIAQGLETLMQMAAEGYTCIGHNVIKFDVPAYKKVYPWFSLPKDRVLDTIILSRLIYPDTGLQDAVLLRRGQLPKKYFKKHSLEAWGYRLGNRKDDYEGDPQIEDEEQRKREKWSRWNQTMEDYCVQDTSTNESLYSFLMAKNPSAESMRLEHDVQWIVCRQIARGVCFDKAAAAKLYADLSQKREELTRALREVFPPFVVNNGKPFIPKRDDKKRGYKAGFPVQKKKTVEFNPGSREHVALMLTRRYGWEPEEFTDDGKPKIDDAVLKKLKYPEAALLADYYMVVKRIGQVAEGDEAWLKRVKPNGRIHGDVTTNGAVTGRMTHSKPNLAQCPKVKLIAGAIALGLEGEYGFECRSCFIAGVGFVIVGADGAALELRDLAGYMAKWDGGAYIKVVLEGRKEDGTEIHTVNQKALEIDSRDVVLRVPLRGRRREARDHRHEGTWQGVSQEGEGTPREVHAEPACPRRAGEGREGGCEGTRFPLRPRRSEAPRPLAALGAQHAAAIGRRDPDEEGAGHPRRDAAAEGPQARHRLRVRPQRPRRVANRNEKGNRR